MKDVFLHTKNNSYVKVILASYRIFMAVILLRQVWDFQYDSIIKVNKNTAYRNLNQ